jgi:hypothetical protein
MHPSAPGNAVKRGSNRVDVLPAGGVVVRHQDDVGVADQLCLIPGALGDVRRGQAPLPQQVDLTLSLRQEHRNGAVGRQVRDQVVQLVRYLGDSAEPVLSASTLQTAQHKRLVGLAFRRDDGRPILLEERVSGVPVNHVAFAVVVVEVLAVIPVDDRLVRGGVSPRRLPG